MRESVAPYVAEPRSKARREATYADLEALPQHVTGEIIEGVLYATPRPAMRHAKAESSIASDIGYILSRPPGGPHGPGRWQILMEPELHFGKDVVVPDIAGWRRERMPVVPDLAAVSLAPTGPERSSRPAAGGMTAFARRASMRGWASLGIGSWIRQRRRWR